jgi:hypothetical protein
MKLIDILKELDKPKRIYADRDPNQDITMADLTPEEYKELLKRGSVLVKMPSDPNRPETSVSKVINLPKIDQIKREVIQNKKEFDVFTFSTNPDIKNTAKEINKLYNQLFRAMNALDKMLELQRKGRI